MTKPLFAPLRPDGEITGGAAQRSYLLLFSTKDQIGSATSNLCAVSANHACSVFAGFPFPAKQGRRRAFFKAVMQKSAFRFLTEI